MRGERISRRQVLKAASVAGMAGVASGGATHAMLADEASFEDGTVAAGSLDLRTRTEYLDEVHPCEWDPTITDEDASNSLTIDSPSGVAGIALSVCDNPGTVALDISGETVDGPSVKLVDGGCDGRVIAEGSLSSVVDALDGGVVLGTGCSRLGKLEANGDGGSFSPEDGQRIDADTFAFQHEGEDVLVAVTDRHYKDGGDEVSGIDLEIDGAEFCKVAVKGGGPPSGGGTQWYSMSCTGGATDLFAGDNPAGRQSALSNVEIYVCGGTPCIPCQPADPHTLFLHWQGATEATDLELVFSAIQCRNATAHGGIQ